MSTYIRAVVAAEAIAEKYGIPLGDLVDTFGDIPAADVVEVRHGQWDGEGDGYADGEIVIDVWYCSECGYCIVGGTDDPNILPNYCPNCGAKMDKEEV